MPRSLLTIDNSDGALPIDYTEVTISRTLFRNGGPSTPSTATTCRLLDVQELLSDSGIGREMHVIVGQGQLDAVLHATPEERRGFIEEAAGVLKHRKRKEKTLRKLDAMQANLTRLSDLLGEIRRQLKPLGRQAEIARERRGASQAIVRDARARLLADDVVTAARAERPASSPTSRRCGSAARRVDSSLAEARERRPCSRPTPDDAARLATAHETWFALAGMRERLREHQPARHRAGAPVPARPIGDEPTGRDPDELEADASRAPRPTNRPP